MSRTNKTKTGSHDFYVGSTKVGSIGGTDTDSMQQQVQDNNADKPSYYGVAGTEYISSVSSSALNIADTPCTMLATIKTDTSAADNKNIMYLWTGASSDALYMRMSSGKVMLRQVGSSTNTDTTSVSDLPVGRWTSIACVRNQTPSQQIYINGVLDKSDTGTNRTITTGTNNVFVGSPSNAIPLTNYARALLFNYALTQDQVRRYSAGAKLDFADIGGSMTPLVPTDDGTGKNQGTFEAGYTNGASLTWWTARANCTGTVTNNAGGGAYGTYCAHIVVNTTGWLYIYRAAATTPGKRYRISFSARKFTTGGDFTGGMASVGAGGNSNATNVTNPDLTTAFQSYSFDFTATDASGVAIATFNTNVPATSGIEIDNISCVQLGAIIDWEPESATPTIWHDESGNQLDGAVTEALINLPHFANTDYGRAAVVQELQDSENDKPSYRFNGSNLITTGSITGATPAYTVLSTFRCGDTGSTDGDNIATMWAGYWIIGIASGTMRNYNAATETMSFSGTYNDGRWHTVTVVQDATAGKTTGWIDGVLNTQRASTYSPSFSSAPYYIGGNSGGNSFKGQISRSVFFNYALSEDKIRRYSAGAKLDYEDVGGSTIVNDDFSTDTYWTKDSLVTISGGKLNFGGVGAGNGIVKGSVATLGKRYRWTYTIDSLSGTGTPGVAPDSTKFTATRALKDGVEQSLSVIGTATGTWVIEGTQVSTVSLYLMSRGTSTTAVVDNLTITQLGAVLDLEPEMIAPTQWRDVSGNGLHGTVSGALATNRISSSHETGTWTPTYTPSSGSYGTAPATNSAFYTKSGRQVSFQIDVTQGTANTAAGAFEFTLPFNTEGTGVYCSTVYVVASNKTGSAVGYAVNSQRAYLYDGTTLWASSARLIITGTYFTAI